MGPRIPPIFTAKCRTSQTWQSPCLSFRRPFPIPDETRDLRCPRPPTSRRLPILLCHQRVASFDQRPGRHNGSVLPYRVVRSIHGAQRTTADCTKCSISDGAYDTASGVCFARSIFIHCPLSARAALLKILSIPQAFRSFQEHTC
jgi:hypothetical protein